MALVPYVIEQTSRGRDDPTISIPGLLKERIIFLGEEVTRRIRKPDRSTASVPGV